MHCPSKKALYVPCHATALFSRRHVMLFCIRLNFQSDKGKMENIGMFNKVRKFIVRENVVDGQCCAQQPPISAIWKTLFSNWIRLQLQINFDKPAKGRSYKHNGREGEERHLLQVRAGVRMVPAKHRLGASRGIGRVDPRVRAVDPLGNM